MMSKKKVNSWDLWDTLISRCVVEPTMIFEIMEVLSEKIEFKKKRIEAEKKSRVGLNETNLDRIYDFLEYSNQELQYLKALEIELEKKLAVPIVENISKFKESDIVISDMYLPENVLLDIVAELSIPLQSFNFFLSNEINLTKKDGKLFQYVSEKLDIIQHTGDHRISDIKQAKKNKIETCYFSDSLKLTDVERYWKEGDFNSKLMAGILRASRLSKPIDFDGNKWDLYAQIISPLFIAFCEYLIQQAIDSKIKVLYFLSRDGQILYKISKNIINSRNVKIKCVYMYASRQALHITGFKSIFEAESWILDRPFPLTIKKISSRTNINSNTLVNMFNNIYYTNITSEVEVSIEKLRDFINHPHFITEIEKSSSLNLEQAKHYFEKIGLLSDWKNGTKIAYVDVGWHGRMQKSLDNICEKFNFDPNYSVGYYMGLMKSPCVESNKNFGFLFSPSQSNSKYKDFKHFDILEFFLNADHPQVLKYDKNNDVIFKENLSLEEITNIQQTQNAILKTLDYYLLIQSTLEGFSILKTKKYVEPFRKLLLYPSLQQVSVLVQSQHTQEQSGNDYTLLIKKISFIDLFSKGNLGMWPEGSAVLKRLYWLYLIRKILLLFLKK